MDLKIHTSNGMRIIYERCRYPRRQLIKCIVVMKLTILFLAFSLQVSAAAFAQDISLNFKNANLREVLQSIRKQSGYSFVVDGNDIKKANPVTITLKTSSIETTLQSLFEKQPFIYKVEGKLIMIRLKEAEKKTVDAAKDDKTVDIKGTVTDEEGKPLSGATVIVKGTQRGVITNEQGRFSLINVPENGTLIIRMVGRESTEITYQNGEIPNIILKEVDQTLREITIAYGKIQEKYTTSNVGTVKGEVIARQPVSNPLIALQGRVPGLYIQQGNGLNTGAIDVTIQGRNSLNNGNQPFYVIDGVPFTPNSLNPASKVMGSIGSGAGISNLNFLNPNEIESITVLKDADATAIYGSRAANGAILITTKKGKSGDTKVDLNLQNGWGKVANRFKVLNTEQYIALKKEALANNNNQPVSASAIDINGTWDPNRSVNWQEELTGETAQFQNLQASLSGGSDNTQFLAGVGYIRETPVFKGDFSNIKTSVNFNVNHTSTDHKFRFFLSGSYLEGNNQLPNDDITARAISLAPNAPDLYNADGSINWAPVPDIRPYQSIDPNPAAMLLARYTNKASNLVANSSISYELIPGLLIKSTFGYNNLQNDEVSIFPSGAQTPEERTFLKPLSTFGDRRIKSWIVEPQATFSRSFSFGTLDGLLGSTFQSTDNYSLTLLGTNYNNDLQLTDYHAAGTKSTLSSLQSTYNYTAIFGRLNYRFRDKYIINLAARRDGSSRFGSENLFHSFYSVGSAWLFSEEDLFRKTLPFINYGKLRASYGTTGNDQIKDYSFYTLYNPVGNITAPYLGVAPLTPGGLSNPYLQWEETRKLNFGIDLGFFDSRILINANYFRNRSSNQLLNQALSIVTGAGFITRNLPALVQNAGWEFNLQYHPVVGRAFNWEGSFNITLPKNKLLRYDGLEKSGDRIRFAIGESINLTKAYSFAGVNPQTGIYQFRNVKGELTSAPSDPSDRTVFITTDPIWYGGFNNTFSYKGFTLDLFFNFTSQQGRNLKYENFPYAQFNTNYLVNVLDHWKKPGDNTPLQMVSNTFSKVQVPFNAAKGSDAAYDKITYARLNNAVLSYNFSNELTKRIHIANARLFIQGQNLLTITNLSNGDPATLTVANIGLLRMYTVGTQITF